MKKLLLILLLSSCASFKQVPVVEDPCKEVCQEQTEPVPAFIIGFIILSIAVINDFR